MRWILRLIGAVVVLAFLALGAFLLVPADRLGGFAADRLSAAFGREVEIDGAVQMRLWPSPRLVADGVRIANPVWVGAGASPLLVADHVELDLRASAFWRGQIRIEEALVSGARATLVRASDGRLSWTLDGGAAVLPDRVSLRGARLRILDRATARTFDVRGLRANIDLSEPSGAASVVAMGVVNGTAMELSGSAADGMAWLAGDGVPIRMDLAWRDGQVTIDGRATEHAAFEGHLDLAGSDLGPLFDLLDTDGPSFPGSLSTSLTFVEGDVTWARSGSLHLRSGRIGMGEAEVLATLDITPAEDRPMMRGTLSIPELALPRPEGAVIDGEWSNQTIDVSDLFATDADITLRSEDVSVGGAQLGATELRLGLTRGRLVFDIVEAAPLGGQLAGQFVVNGRGGLSVGGDLILAGADIGALADVFGVDGLNASGSLSIEFLGVGNDLRTLFDGFEGEGDITLSTGTYAGLRLQNGATGQGQVTEFDRALTEFRIRDGVLLPEDMIIDLPWGVVEGSGEVALGARILDITLTPITETVSELPVPVRLIGPWDGPEVNADAEALAQRDAAAEEDANLAAARAELAQERLTPEAVARLEPGELPEVIEAFTALEFGPGVEPDETEETQ